MMPSEGEQIIEAIRTAASTLQRSPSRSEFIAQSGISEYRVLTHFPSWNDAVRAAGLEPDETNVRAEDADLLGDWGELVRKNRRIPTRHQYRREGKYSPGVFDRHFGPWSALPEAFRRFAENRPEWADVLALLPVAESVQPASDAVADVGGLSPIGETAAPAPRHVRLEGRPTYGDPIDFRGLRHEPVNEDGVVFLFGMVARELGYLVEAVQAGFPDCEAKRQIGPGKWQRVRIEFEYESRNFRDHGHPVAGCDLIVCWRHNWSECPGSIEVVELRSVIKSLGTSDI